MNKRLKKRINKIKEKENLEENRIKELEKQIVYQKKEFNNTIEVLNDNMYMTKEIGIEKIDIANKLLNSYIKEEKLLKYIQAEIITEDKIRLKNEINNLKDKIEMQKISNEKLIEEIRLDKIDILMRLLNSHIKEEQLLNSFLKLKKKNNELNKKYDALKKSKLGKLTLWYWRKKKGVNKHNE